MTGLPGGPADKAGNVYEHLWTATRIADLLHGTVIRIRLEPPGDDGVGIEFEVAIAGTTWGEQTKHSGATWTIKRLKEDGVLSAAKHQVELGRGFRLITSSAATALASLSDRARATQTLTEFKSTLTTKLEPDFDDVVKDWAVSGEEAWRLLKMVVVEHEPIEPLRRNARLAFQILDGGDPDTVIAAVRDFCDAHLHEDITAPQVATHLKSKGFQARLLAGDDDVRRRLHRTLERHQRRVWSTTPDFGLVARSESQSIIQHLEDPDTPQLLIVDGPAGFGKSAVVADVASTLEERGWFVAVARMDVDTLLPTSDHLGVQMGLADSPSVLLAGVADGSRGVLVVDQLDAVSLFSGRMPDSFDAVEEALEEIRRAPNLKLLLVVRTVDLENDQRLRSLQRDEGAATRYTIDKLDRDRVREHLIEHGVHVPADETVELLRTPLHLAVYARLSEEARRLQYRTLQDLYDELTSEVRRCAADRAGHLDWAGVTSALVTHMSEHETVTAPRALLDRFAVEEIAALESEAVLVSDDAGVTFFHESYFDYLFARAFVGGGGDLHAFLSTSGQFLFRRAQTRQVVEYVAATDRQRFRDVTAQLLASPDIRSHLKHVVVGVLRQITPSAADWAAIENVAWSEDSISGSFLTLLSDPRWFDAADELGRWEEWLADASRVDRAAHQLIFAARERGERAGELFRPYVGANEDWRRRLRALVSWSMCPALVPFALELIEGGYVDDARGPIAINSDFWSIGHALKDDGPTGAARITGAYLRRGLVRARADGSEDPFESEHLSTHSQSDALISEVAVKAPYEFVREVLPFVADVAVANQYTSDELLPAGRRWSSRYRDTADTVDDTVFAATEDALQRLAADAPEAALEAIAPIRDAESEELRFLVCRTLTALSDADDAVAWLLSDPRNLVLGWSDSPNWASRELIAAHSEHCSDQLYRLLETTILDYRSKYVRKGVGRGQYVLLSGLDRGRMTDAARRRLGELERRFDEPPPEPRPVMASFVGSPIPDDASKRMSDENWLAALRKHDSDKTDWRGEVPVGGASQLAQVLGQRAKDDPERFARLALRFDASIPATAIAHIIRNVHSSIELDLLTDLGEHAAILYGEDVGRDVCSAAEAVRAINDRLAALINRFSTASDPDREWARIDTGSGNRYYGGDLFHAGLNSTRGEAALAAAAALFIGAEHLERLASVVERLAVDPSMGVRTCAAEAVVALLNHDNDAALELAERLFDAAVDVFDARTSERLLTYCVLRAPKRFAPHLERALGGPPSVAKRAGHVWAVAQFRGAIAPPLSDDVKALRTPARVGVAEVLADNIADTAQGLSLLFDDDDAGVRDAAAKGMRNISDVDAEALDPLIEAFVDSPAFAENMEDLIDALEKLGTKLPLATLRACERAVEIAGTELGDIRSARSMLGTDLITVVLRLYRQRDETTRARCLDLIDRLTDMNVYGLDKALAGER